MSQQSQSPRLGAIFGSGRSGTTWLGAIASSHPEVAYRFEPFHRVEEQDFVAAEEKILSAEFGPDDLSQVSEALLKALPLIEKPPFFPRSYPILFASGRRFLWPLARTNKIAERLFKTLYTPKMGPFLVFKEVAKTRVLRQLIERTDTPIVYLMRHPCAVLHSLLRGQEKNWMAKGRRTVLGNWLDERGEPALRDKYKPRVEELTIAQSEALLWRMEVEEALRAIEKNSGGTIVVYEELTEKPHEIAERMFDHFGYEGGLHPQCSEFIDASIKGDNSWPVRFKYGEIGIRAYFSVFRNPKKSRDAWKEKMPAEERKQVLEIVRDSKAFEIGLATGLWDDC